MIRRISSVTLIVLALVAGWLALSPLGAQTSIRTPTAICDWLSTTHCIKPDVNGAVPVTGAFTVTGASQYPLAAVPITASATGTTGVTTATLAASALVKTYICGFSIRAVATAAAVGNATVTGTVTGTLNYTQFTAPAASAIGTVEQTFNPCVPGSAINTAIAVVSSAPGTGGVISVTAWGYQQ